MVNKTKLWRRAERALKRSKRYQQNRSFDQEENYELMYVLIKEYCENYADIIIIAGYQDDYIQIGPGPNTEIDLYEFNFERDLFMPMTDGYEIAGMSVKCHADIWYTLESWHETDIRSFKQIMKYLKRCKRSGITETFLQKEIGYSGMDMISKYLCRPAN